MQSTATTTLPATPRVHRTVPTPQLRAAFAQVPDPRRRHGTRDPLAALLSLAVAARLANHRSLWAMADWGAAPSDAIKQALGFPSPQPPHLSTLQRRFRRLAAATLAAALTACFDPAAPGEVRPRGSQGIALDGNAQRGRLPHDVRGTHPIPAVRARCHDLGVVLAQLGVDRQRHAAELTVVPALLQHLDWQGRVLPGDALDCQRDLCAQVVAAGGADLVLVDGTHPTLQADIVQLVAPPPPPAPGHPAWTIEEQSARLVEPGPGRLEVREIRVSSERHHQPAADGGHGRPRPAVETAGTL